MTQKRLDQFYTNEDVALQCLEMVSLDGYDIILEPSAGSGAFYKHLPPTRRLGLDLEPAHDEIMQQDYFEFVPDKTKSYLIIGNPPFGKNSSLAKRFFNKSAEFSDAIAFVLPRTFRKPSTINQLDKYFHLSKDVILGKNSFHLPDGTLYNVPCVFQVWERRPQPRKKIPTVVTCDDFEFVGIDKPKGGPPTEQAMQAQRDAATICIRRVGAGAGDLYDDYRIKKRDWKSHYYIKTDNPRVREIMSRIVWDDASGKYDTAGNPSISKNDLIRNYHKTKESLRKGEK